MACGGDHVLQCFTDMVDQLETSGQLAFTSFDEAAWAEILNIKSLFKALCKVRSFYELVPEMTEMFEVKRVKVCHNAFCSVGVARPIW